MGLGGTSRDHQAVDPLPGDGLFDLFLGIPGTGKHLVSSEDHPGQSLGEFHHLFYVHHACDIAPAMANEYAYARCLNASHRFDSQWLRPFSLG